MSKRPPLLEPGAVFGRWVVTSAPFRKGRYLYVRVRCSCGQEKSLEQSSLRSGRTNSCGCLNSEVLSARSTTHGLRAHPVYAVWNAMMQRCHNPNSKQAADYGARGITVDPAWHTFGGFHADMGLPPYKGATLERKDNDKGYSKDNCVWADRVAQSRNKRNTVKLIYEGVEVPLQTLAEQWGIGSRTLYQRLYTYKMPLEKALAKGPGPGPRKPR